MPAQASLCFEQSPALIAFRTAAGDANRLLNTLLVAVETLHSGVTPVRPADMAVAWSLPTTNREWLDTRNFALRGTMVVLVDALDRYLKILSRVPGLTAPELDDRLNGRKAAGEDHRPTLPERVASLCLHYKDAVHPSYVLAVALLVAWRNRFVHLEHRANLSKTERQQLLHHAAFLKQEFAGVVIAEVIARFDAGVPPTLVDLSTLLAATHRLVRDIDAHLLHLQDGKDYALALMRYLLEPGCRRAEAPLGGSSDFGLSSLTRRWITADGIWYLPLARCTGQGKLRRDLPSMCNPSLSPACRSRPCPPCSSASGPCTEIPGGIEEKVRNEAREKMEKAELERLKDKVPCAAVLERAGFALDLKESTRKAVKFRRDAAIIIVIHDGRGWFDPLSDRKGDVFRLVEHLEGVPFVDAMNEVAGLVGFAPTTPPWGRQLRQREPDLSVPERWRARRNPWRGSATWRYLTGARRIAEPVLRAVIAAGSLREGPRGSMWAAHRDAEGIVTGWEERGPDWRGFATGGAKVLFRLGLDDARRLCVTEAAIDAMSLAAIEGFRSDTLYLSTGGGWSPATAAAIRALINRPGVQLIAATDNNKQGDVYAERLLALAGEVGCSAERLRPLADDWNSDLKGMKKVGGPEGTGQVPHARRPRQG